MDPKTARRTIVRHWPVAPNSMSLRRPMLSIINMATMDARKYSVALQAAIMRDLVSEIPKRSKRRV